MILFVFVVAREVCGSNGFSLNVALEEMFPSFAGLTTSRVSRLDYFHRCYVR
jgi:hypothetical protein